MKKLMFILITVFVGILLAGGLEFPNITYVEHEILYRKTPEFVDFNYLIEIQGAYRDYDKLLLEIELYDIDEEQIKVFREIIDVKKNKFQTFEGTKIIPIELADEIEFVGAKLKRIAKKY